MSNGCLGYDSLTILATAGQAEHKNCRRRDADRERLGITGSPEDERAGYEIETHHVCGFIARISPITAFSLWLQY